MVVYCPAKFYEQTLGLKHAMHILQVFLSNKGSIYKYMHPLKYNYIEKHIRTVQFSARGVTF